MKQLPSLKGLTPNQEPSQDTKKLIADVTQEQLDELRQDKIHPLVLNVLFALCVLFKLPPDSANARKLLSNSSLLQKMKTFSTGSDRNHSIHMMLDKYVHMSEFNPELVSQHNAAAGKICQWIIAMHQADSMQIK